MIFAFRFATPVGTVPLLLVLGSLVGGSVACSPQPPASGTGGTSGSGGIANSGGTSAGGLPGSGGAAPGSGGESTSGGSGGSPGSGGQASGGTEPGSGGAGTGGTQQTGFVCPPGSESMTPTLTGTPAALAGTLPPTPGSGSNAILEGPVWIDGTLYFSQIRDYGPHNPSQIVTHDGTDYSIFMPDSGTNGLAIRADGMILAASHGVGGLVEIDPNATTPTGTTVIADYMGSRLNSPNDLAIRSDGNVYFSDPDYQCDSPCEDQADNRVYRYPAGGGELEAIPTGHDEPNGVLLSLDGTKLYVSGGGGIEVYTLDAGGAVTDGPDPLGGATLSNVDGMSKDCAGNIYAAANGDVSVLSPTGALVGGGTIVVPNETTNIAFGGPSGTVLYVTTRAQAGIYTVDVGIPGYPD